MNPYYQKYIKRDSYPTRYYKNRGYYYQIRNNRYLNNNYINYQRNYQNYRRMNYENTFEKENNYEKETCDNSFSKSTNSNSRQDSFCENIIESKEINYNNKNNDEINKNPLKNDNIIKKLNLSENILKTAYFVPKKYKDNKNIIEENKKKEIQKEEDKVILAINIKISKENYVFFQIKKSDDVCLKIKKFCEENEINQQLNKYLSIIISKVLNSINQIKNLELKKEEIKLLTNLREIYS